MGANKGSKKGKKPAFLAAAEAEAAEAAKAKSKTKKVIRGAAAKADVDAGRRKVEEAVSEQPVSDAQPEAQQEAVQPAEKDPRVHVISVRVSREEADALMTMADAADMRLAAWARHILMECVKP